MKRSLSNVDRKNSDGNQIEEDGMSSRWNVFFSYGHKKADCWQAKTIGDKTIGTDVWRKDS